MCRYNTYMHWTFDRAERANFPFLWQFRADLERSAGCQQSIFFLQINEQNIVFPHSIEQIIFFANFVNKLSFYEKTTPPTLVLNGQHLAFQAWIYHWQVIFIHYKPRITNCCRNSRLVVFKWRKLKVGGKWKKDSIIFKTAPRKLSL